MRMALRICSNTSQVNTAGDQLKHVDICSFSVDIRVVEPGEEILFGNMKN
jgi:hypothetical protein